MARSSIGPEMMGDGGIGPQAEWPLSAPNESLQTLVAPTDMRLQYTSGLLHRFFRRFPVNCCEAHDQAGFGRAVPVLDGQGGGIDTLPEQGFRDSPVVDGIVEGPNDLDA